MIPFSLITPPQMGKIVSRGIVTKSKETADSLKGTHTLYCTGCGDFLLVLTSPLGSLPRRPIDNSYVLINEGEKKRVYKLNAVESLEAEGKLVHRGEGQFEFQSEFLKFILPSFFLVLVADMID